MASLKVVFSFRFYFSYFYNTANIERIEELTRSSEELVDSVEEIRKDISTSSKAELLANEVAFNARLDALVVSYFSNRYFVKYIFKMCT